MAPSSNGRVARPAVTCSVPAFHRMNAKAIADRFTVELQWLREYAARADLNVAWNRQSEAREMLLEARNGPHAADGWIRSFAHPR